MEEGADDNVKYEVAADVGRERLGGKKGTEEGGKKNIGDIEGEEEGDKSERRRRRWEKEVVARR